MNTAFVCSTNFHFCFGRQECFHINSYLKCVGCLVIQGLQSNFEIRVGGGGGTLVTQYWGRGGHKTLITI